MSNTPTQNPHAGGPSAGGPRTGGPGGPGGSGGRGKPRQDRKPRTDQPEEAPEFVDKVVHINRCAKVVKGGRRFSFAALVVSGDQKGRVGVGYGKAKEVPEAIRKGTEKAQHALKRVNLKNNTIPHRVIGKADGGRVLLLPASPGTGVIAGGGVRAVLEAVGIKDILSKSLGSNNPLAMVKATLDGLHQLRTYEQIRNLKARAVAREEQ